MKRPDKMKTPGCGGQALGETAEAGNLKRNGSRHCPMDIAQRRADSIRLQALSPLIGGA